MPTETRRLRPSGIALAVAVACVPALISLLLPVLFFDAGITGFMPFYNDEVDYWHESLTFSQLGFEGGYYTVDEYPAPAGFTPFGTHGPAVPLIYGTLGALFGWQLYSAPLIHLVWVTAALAVFLLVARPAPRGWILSALYLGAFWAGGIFLMSNMQEPLHFAIGALIAAAFHRMLSAQGAPSAALRWTSVSLLVIAALIRPTWILLLPPLLALPSGPRPLRRLWPALLVSIVATFAVFLTFRWLAAPDPAFFTTHGLSSPVGARLGHLAENLGRLLSLGTPHPLELIQRLQLLAVLATCGVALIGALRRGGALDRRAAAGIDENLFHLFNIGAPMAAALLFYDFFDWRDYKLAAPHLLASVLLMIAGRRRVALVGGLIAANLLASIWFFPAYREFNGPYFLSDRQSVATFRRQAEAVRFEAGADRWCNTLLTPSDPYQLVALPAGVGISYLADPSRLRYPLRSRYVLLDPAWLAENREFAQSTRLRLLSRTIVGELYENLDAPCGRVLTRLAEEPADRGQYSVLLVPAEIVVER